MATTLGHLESVLGRFVPSDDSFADYLNIVCPTLYALGNWKDLVEEQSLTTDHPYVALPREFDSVLAACVDDVPMIGSSRWQDYKTVGMAGAAYGPPTLYGLVDDGYHPTMIDLVDGDADGDGDYNFRIESDDPSETNLPTSGAVTIQWVDPDGDTNVSVLEMPAAAASVATTETAGNGARIIKHIIFRDIAFDIKVIAEPVGTGSEFDLAKGRLNEVIRYRRYRLSNPSDLNKTVTLLMKRRWFDLKSPSDIVYLSDMAVLKHGILGQVAEDNSDLEAAQYHWQKCRELLESEMHQYRGGIRIKANLNPTGNGGPLASNIM